LRAAYRLDHRRAFDELTDSVSCSPDSNVPGSPLTHDYIRFRNSDDDIPLRLMPIPIWMILEKEAFNIVRAGDSYRLRFRELLSLFETVRMMNTEAYLNR
jgi:hypothetical protein